MTIWNNLKSRWASLTGSKRGKSKTSRSAAQGDQQWNPARTLEGVQYLALVVVIFTLVAGYRPALRALERYADQSRARPITPREVTLRSAPTWMPEGFRLRMQKLVADEAGSRPLESDGLYRAARALLATGWVDQVRSIRRLPRGIEVLADFRQPVAFVVQSDTYRLVDKNAIRLPGSYTAAQVKQLGLPWVTGAGPAPRREGERWPGKEVSSALELLSLLKNQPYAAQVRSVNVSQRDPMNRIRLTLETAHGQVVWGLPPGEESAVEPLVPVKLARLLEIYRSQGTIDAGGRIVELYGPAVFVRDLTQPTSDLPTRTVMLHYTLAQ